MNDQQLYEVLLRKYQSVQSGDKTWGDVAEEVLDLGVDKTANALRKWFHRRYSGEVDFSLGIEPEVIVNTPLDKFSNGTIEDKIWVTSNLDPEQWELVKFWGSLENPQASFKPKQVATENILEVIKEKLNKDWYISKAKKTTGNLFVPSLVDAHIGKRTWDGYNVEDYFLSVLGDLLEKALKQGNISRTMLPFGSDFGHIDNVHYTTTAGTPQEANANYADIIASQVSIAVKSVEMLAEQMPVDVEMLPGNHDRFSNLWLGHVFEQRFENHPNVKVNNKPHPRKYYSYNNALIAMMHGDQESKNNVGNIISSEARHLLSETNYTEVLWGHTHGRQDVFTLTSEMNGIMMRTLPSLSGPDTWHQFKGFIKNGRGGMALVYTSYGCEYVYYSPLEKFL